MQLSKKQIIVLHKSGPNSHYRGLQCLADQQEYEVIYREFSILSKMVKSFTKMNFKLFKKQWVNLFTLLNLLFSKNKKIVLGIAPYDKTLLRLRKVISGHEIYYHTSWPIWDGENYPKRKKVTNHVKSVWRHFLEDSVNQVFVVTGAAKKSLQSHYKLKKEAQVVAHSYCDINFYEDLKLEKKSSVSFCYAGRLVPQKGIIELLDFFKTQSQVSFHIIGNGPLEKEIKNITLAYDHITLESRTNDYSKLNTIFNQHDYLLLNSQSTKKWQELFGMVLIEAMAAGCIPVATNHVGPLEIITNLENGYLFTSDGFIDGVRQIVNSKPSEQMINSTLSRAQNFEVAQIAQCWRSILNLES